MSNSYRTAEAIKNVYASLKSHEMGMLQAIGANAREGLSDTFGASEKVVLNVIGVDLGILNLDQIGDISKKASLDKSLPHESYTKVLKSLTKKLKKEKSKARKKKETEDKNEPSGSDADDDDAETSNIFGSDAEDSDSDSSESDDVNDSPKKEQGKKATIVEDISADDEKAMSELFNVVHSELGSSAKLKSDFAKINGLSSLKATSKAYALILMRSKDFLDAFSKVSVFSSNMVSAGEFLYWKNFQATITAILVCTSLSKDESIRFINMSLLSSAAAYRGRVDDNWTTIQLAKVAKGTKGGLVVQTVGKIATYAPKRFKWGYLSKTYKFRKPNAKGVGSVNFEEGEAGADSLKRVGMIVAAEKARMSGTGYGEKYIPGYKALAAAYKPCGLKSILLLPLKMNASILCGYAAGASTVDSSVKASRLKGSGKFKVFRDWRESMSSMRTSPDAAVFEAYYGQTILQSLVGVEERKVDVSTYASAAYLEGFSVFYDKLGTKETRLDDEIKKQLAAIRQEAKVFVLTTQVKDAIALFFPVTKLGVV